MHDSNFVQSRRDQIKHYHRIDEAIAIENLLDIIKLSDDAKIRIENQANIFVRNIRDNMGKMGGIDAFMQEYELTNKEGIVLMCLAEALLRIPDPATAHLLIQDKLGQADFDVHMQKSTSRFVKLSSWALKATTQFLAKDEDTDNFLGKIKGFLADSSMPLIRRSAYYAMGVLADKFVIGRNIDRALKRALKDINNGYCHSFDMLGEAALTQLDADRYYHEYFTAVHAIAAFSESHIKNTALVPSISIKLSALHPRYEEAKRERVFAELYQKLLTLCIEAKNYSVAVTIDAEEAARLELSLDLFEKLSGSAELTSWNGLGLAVQAYQKRAVTVIDWLAELGHRHQRRINVRLVKGAYWDTEIKLAQVGGHNDYPVFTRKSSTDLSYLACAQKLLADPLAFYPAFATHNAYTIATVLELAAIEGNHNFELQKLHGMGDIVYQQVFKTLPQPVPCRIYAPVGNHQDLLPYLVRRLLENGANNSFINLIGDSAIAIHDLNRDVIDKTRNLADIRHPHIVLPENLYGAERLNSSGVDLDNEHDIQPILAVLANPPYIEAASIIDGNVQTSETVINVVSPFDQNCVVGQVRQMEPADLHLAVDSASQAQRDWSSTPVAQRAECLMRMADLMEKNHLELIQLCVYEGGKTIADAIAEIREAIDFCRYYAVQGRRIFTEAVVLKGPTGEYNTLQYEGHGVFACISPWNFPLAIFLGQITAALVAGNTVIAKPAGQTSLIAYYTVQLLYKAGIPSQVLQLVLTSGQNFSKYVLNDKRIAGVAFTGSNQTAWSINQILAERRGAIVPLIAETGGLNVMLVDSSALIEQVVADVIASAFQSAGQRCSALRAIVIQDDIADRFIEILTGAMAELSIGKPTQLATDVGPVINRAAAQELQDYCTSLRAIKPPLFETPLTIDTAQGSFVAPTVFEIDSINQLVEEQFGPILHVIRFNGKDLDRVINDINNLGYGLTFGLHTRIDQRIRDITKRIKVGNVYVNRNIIGAVVGVQPFGGCGLSGTGPKAGGPHYLQRFATEKTVSINTTAQGGNTALMTMDEN